MSKLLHPASKYLNPEPKPALDLVRRCPCAVAGFVTMENGRTEHLGAGCHRVEDHKGRHRGWAATLTKSRVRISWKNEER